MEIGVAVKEDGGGHPTEGMPSYSDVMGIRKPVDLK